jgi:DNA-binding CsgD family transcriptional regulator
MIGHNLTDTEFDVLCLAADGHTAGSSAAVRGRGEETVKSQRKSLLAKLGAVNMTEAVAIAFREGLLE